MLIVQIDLSELMMELLVIKHMNRLPRLFTQSIQATFAFKTRALFCIVSVALGIASVILIIAAMEGAYVKAFDIVEKFGPDSVLITGGDRQLRATGNVEKTITLDDLAAIKESFPEGYVVNPVVTIGACRATYKNKKFQTHLVGVGDNYSVAWSWPLVQGRGIIIKDITGVKNVAVIGQYLARELFGEYSPVGKYIFVKGFPVRIIGILQKKGMTPNGQNLDNRILIPITTAMKKVQNEKKYISAIKIRFSDQTRINYYVEELEVFLKKRHKILPGAQSDFTTISPKEIIVFLVTLTGTLILFIGTSGIISLFVAGFVIANLFLLSVKERSQEIGIRRALGASQMDIILQFLGESVILTTLGGIAGSVLGLFSSKLFAVVADFPMHFSWKGFAVGLLLSSLVGILSGIQPSLVAARLNPVEAITK